MVHTEKSRFLSGRKLLVIVLMFIAVSVNAQWVQMSNGMGNDKIIYGFASNGIYIFSVADTNGVFRSTNNGLNWISTNNGLPSVSKRCVAISGTNIFVGTSGGGVYMSTNNGDNWASANNGITNFNVSSLTVVGTDIFAGTSGNLYRSTNNGATWNQILSLSGCSGIGNVIVKGTLLFIAPSFYTTSKIYVSSNNGINWSAGNTSILIYSLIAVGNDLFKGTYQGVGISTNNGVNWTAGGLQEYDIDDFTMSGTNLFAATWRDTVRGGVFLTTNNGVNWISKSQGLDVMVVNCLYVYNGYLYAGTHRSSVYRRSLSEIIGIQSISSEIPSSFSLSQNYPNPFNPSTKIQFTVPLWKGAGGRNTVTLKVYDIAGREVQTLVNEELQPGTYEATFNGKGLNSGVYYYKLTAGNYSEAKKMLFVK